MKVSVREARQNFSSLLNQVEAGEEITITRNGKEVAVLKPKDSQTKTLPDLTEFRKSIRLTAESMSKTVVNMREKNRY